MSRISSPVDKYPRDKRSNTVRYVGLDLKFRVH
uniref:Uncharacterized protein n=1 Tax=Romanomermis culicivorax TaxID=13658 RepID=A0A915KKW9_ROMCU